MKIFLVNHHHTEQCGVYQHGRRVALICAHSPRHQYHNVEANNEQEFRAAWDAYGKPDVCVFNTHPITLSWAYTMPLPGVVSVGTFHEGTWQDAVTPPECMDAWIWHDPSLANLPGLSPRVLWTPRPLPYFTGGRDENGVPWKLWVEGQRPYTIGSFGFAFGGKGFEDVVDYAREKGKTVGPVRVRLHLPNAYFGGDPTSAYAKQLQRDYPEVEISTDFMSDDALLSWLAGNDENALLYHTNWGRGISSASDFAVAAGRPMTLSNSSQFRHIHHFYNYQEPDFPVPARHTYDPMPLQRAWHPQAFLERHDAIMEAIAR